MCRDDPKNDWGILRIGGEKSRNEACRYLGVDSYARNEPRIINKERKVGKKREEFERERVAKEGIGPFSEAGAKGVKGTKNKRGIEREARKRNKEKKGEDNPPW